jgi:DNA primase
VPSVIEISGGKDPDEALKNEPSLFKKAVREDQGVYDYLLTKTVAANNPATAEGKKQIADELLPLISGIKNEIIKEHYLRKISSILETSYESIAKEIEHFNTREQTVVIKAIPGPKRLKEEIMEEYLLSLIIQSVDPKVVLQKAIKVLSDSLSKERAYQKILYHLLDHFTKADSFDGKQFASALPTELVTSYDTSLLYPLPHFDDQQKLLSEVEKIANKLRTSYIHQKMKHLAKEIEDKEQAGEEKDIEELKKKYSLLASRLEVG